MEQFARLDGGFPGGAKPVIYATGPARFDGGSLKGGVWASDDGGGTWRDAAGAFAPSGAASGRAPSFSAIACCLADPKAVYVSYNGVDLGPGAAQSTVGVAEDTDGGKSSGTSPFADREGASPDVHDFWVSPFFGPDWGSNPIDLTVGPRDANLAYGTDYGRSMRSDRRPVNLGLGLLEAGSRRPGHDARPRRDHLLRRPLRPVRFEARSSSPTPTSAL